MMLIVIPGRDSSASILTLLTTLKDTRLLVIHVLEAVSSYCPLTTQVDQQGIQDLSETKGASIPGMWYLPDELRASEGTGASRMRASDMEGAHRRGCQNNVPEHRPVVEKRK